ncbi:hypothetical protein ACWKWU_04725 [Chitinophaga lutea]
MSRTFLVIPVLALLFVACKKKDDQAAPIEEKLIAQIIAGNDSLKIAYNDDRTLRRFYQFTEALPYWDSTQVEYDGGGIARYKYWTFDEQLTDRSFVYNASQQLTRINYYGFTGSGMGVTDYDSLEYAQGKLKAYHILNGGERNAVRKIYWQNDDIIKVEWYDVNLGVETVKSVQYFSYNDKPNLSENFSRYFLFSLSDEDYSLLSKHAPVTAREEVVLGATRIDTLIYSFNTKGLLEQIDRKETSPGNSVLTTKIGYITVQ